MAAYAALVSLLNDVEQIRNHPHFSTCFDKEQMESLLARVDFFLDFIETHNSRKEEAEELEKKIAFVAQDAETQIDYHIVSLINNYVRPIAQFGSIRNLSCFCVDPVKFNKSYLRKIMERMDCIKEKVLKVKEEIGCRAELPETSMPAAASSRPLIAGKSNMVGFEGYSTRLLEKLIGHQTDRTITPLSGMGGIGKTTLARNAYDNLLVVQHFDARAWVTISQTYTVREILLDILSCLGQSNDGMDKKDEHELGVQLHKTLFCARYLIVLDDMWSIDVWDEINNFFPDNCNGSRIIVTTRISDVANHFGSAGLALDFLDDDHSWELFCEKVFSKETCPPELKEIGMKIVKNCKGLPLSVVVIGGLLRDSSRTLGQWENVERDMRSILNTSEDSRCSKLLTLSYSHLPACLKPCFLYFALFPEDEVIKVSRLVKLWVAEGFIKPKKDQSLEEIAESYIEDLVGRNLVYVCSLRWNGKFKTCSTHDLLRDLSIRLARKEEFVCDASVLDTPQCIRRWCHSITPKSPDKKVNGFRRLVARSLVYKGHMPPEVEVNRLLRVLIAKSAQNLFLHFNLRYFALQSLFPTRELPPLISLFWNVQTLIIAGYLQVFAPSAIWKIPQLRHLKFTSITLPDPPSGDATVLHNLQALGRTMDFKFSNDACARMPNIKKLHAYYGDFSRGADTLSYYCIHNFVLFNNLESLHIEFQQQSNQDNLLRPLSFPNSLKKLTLEYSQLEWNDMRIFGSLPHLEALKLSYSVSGPNWYPVEGEFLRLKYLRICFSDLFCWNADSTHFPLLESLVLEKLYNLDEIPSGIGDIPTLESIYLVDCSIPATLSAIRIVQEQESMGNEGFQVNVNFRHKRYLEKFMEEVNLEGLTGVKFQIRGV